MESRMAQSETAGTGEALREPGRSWLAAGQAAWPDLQVPDDAFVAFVAAKLTARPECSPDSLAIGDLYLAFACSRGEARALQTLEAQALHEAEGALGRFNFDRATLEEVKQVARERLLVGTPERPARIAEYAGIGPLRAWLRVVLSREALNLTQKERRELPMPDSLLEALPAGDDNPELSYLRERHRSDFQAAIAQALAGLTRRQRNLLRHYFVYRLSIDQIGAIYHVHRATVARSIAKAQDELQGRARAILGARLRLDARECESLMRTLGGLLELTLRRLLKAA
jgi:RNA polymerase sigma-70 factor (ECF subfamily)